MKKPVVMMVSPDTETLRVLGQALRERFGGLCRIIRFRDETRAVEYAAASAARDEGVSLAIVDRAAGAHDQAMTALRGARNGADSQLTVHLTHEFGVPRHRNRERVGALLEGAVSAVSSELARRFRDDESHHHVFRELRGAVDLRGMLALRHRVYSATAGLQRLPSLDPITGMDADAYDLCSHHFGLFVRERDRDELIGGVRLTESDFTPTAAAVREACADHPTLLARIDAPRPAPLPMAGCLTDRAFVDAFVATIIARGERPVEGGRLVLDSRHRGHVGSGRHAARHLIDGAVASALGHGNGRYLINCRPEHRLAYRQYGFTEVPGTQERFEPDFGFSRVCLHAAPDDLPSTLRAQCERMVARLREHGEACTCTVAATRGGGAALRAADDAICARLAARQLETLPAFERDPVFSTWAERSSCVESMPALRVCPA